MIVGPGRSAYTRAKQATDNLAGDLRILWDILPEHVAPPLDDLMMQVGRLEALLRQGRKVFYHTSYFAPQILGDSSY